MNSPVVAIDCRCFDARGFTVFRMTWRSCHGCTVPLLVAMEHNPPKNEALRELVGNRPLRLQCFAPALRMVTLACWLLLCIGTCGAAVSFRVVGDTVASGMGAFRFAIMGLLWSNVLSIL
jgi:hypothetical protein